MNTTAPIGPSPSWARRWLQAAGLYNLAWGIWVVLWPGSFFSLLGLDPPNYPQIWQCVGMIVGVYGIGYLIAAGNSRVHWPIVLVGLLGKILGPIGFGWALLRGELPPQFGVTILTNDLLWWAPFAMILWDAARARGALPEGPRPDLASALDALHDQHGRSLRSISDATPTLVVFLRHSGCTFCRSTLAELAAARDRLDGVALAVVSMSDPEENVEIAHRQGLEWASWFSDPQRTGYRAFELERGRFTHLFGPKVWLRGAVEILRGRGLGPLKGDGFQLGGSFLLHRGRIVRAHRNGSAADQCRVGELLLGVSR